MTQADNEKKCCSECSNDPDGNDYSHKERCINPNCKCHTTASDRTFEEKCSSCCAIDCDKKRCCHTKVEVGEWAAQIQNAAAAQFWKAVEKANNSPSMLVLEVIMVQNIEHMRQRAHEEGRNAKGSSFREGYQRGLEEGRKAGNKSKVITIKQEQLDRAFEAGKQAMRQELREEIGKAQRNYAQSPEAQAALLDVFQALLKDTGSSNK